MNTNCVVVVDNNHNMRLKLKLSIFIVEYIIMFFLFIKWWCVVIAINRNAMK